MAGRSSSRSLLLLALAYWLYRLLRQQTLLAYREEEGEEEDKGSKDRPSSSPAATSVNALLQRAIERCKTLRRGYRATPLLVCLDLHGHWMTIVTNIWQRILGRLAKAPVSNLLVKPSLLATLLAPSARQRQQVVEYQRETLRMEDGGTIALDWEKKGVAGEDSKDGTNENSDVDKRPTLIIMHGLCGDGHSPYMYPLVKLASDRGWRTVVMVARGCGDVPLTSYSTFTAARISDFGEAIRHIKQKYPGAPLFGIGFSLGAGLIVKYLGTKGEDSGLDGAVSVSIAFDYLKTTGPFNLWSRYKLVKDLKAYVRANLEELKARSKVDLGRLMKAKNVREFDSIAIVKTHGYRDVDHYYDDASAHKVSHNVKTPCLALVAEDDPVCSAEGCPRVNSDKLGPGLVIARTPYGGHVSYGQGGLFLPDGISWAHDVALDWFHTLLDLSEKSS